MCEASKDQAYVICNQTHELDLSVKQTNNRTLDKTSQLRLQKSWRVLMKHRQQINIFNGVRILYEMQVLFVLT